VPLSVDKRTMKSRKNKVQADPAILYFAGRICG
jgi:hypothetical protein